MPFMGVRRNDIHLEIWNDMFINDEKTSDSVRNV